MYYFSPGGFKSKKKLSEESDSFYDLNTNVVDIRI